MLIAENRSVRSTLLSKPAVETTSGDIRCATAPSVPLIARDSFVAETASKLEQLQATVRLMSRDLARMAETVGELQQAADQDRRWHKFLQSEQRGKEAKADELVRSCRDLKGRLDRITSQTGGGFHAYNSFEAVSRKLGELEAFREEARRFERSLRLKATMLCAAIGASALVIVLANALTSRF